MESHNFGWHNYHGTPSLKILIVYPDSTSESNEVTRNIRLLPILPNALDEVMQVVNLLGARLLTGGRANIHGLLDVLAEGWDILWLVTHCDEGGWYLRDGPIAISQTVSLVRTAGIWLCVLNTCSSINLARQVADELGTAVIATISPVPDRQAMITGVLFAQAMARGTDYVTAFQLAQPGQQDNPYRLVEARVQNEMGQDRRNYPPDNTTATLQKLQRSVDELEQLLYGSSRLHLPALKDTVYELDTEISKLHARVGKIEERQRIRFFMMWGVAAGLLLLTMIVITVLIRVSGLI